MRAPLSVIIPTLNAEEDLPATLSALSEGLQSGLIRELIISDGGSQDSTAAIADAAGAIWVTGGPSRGGQLRRGVAVARGAYVLLLHADTQLSAGWSGTVHAAIAAHQNGCFRLAFRSAQWSARWVAGWANLRTSLFGLPYGDQGFLVAQDVLAAAGGVPDQPLMEDVALARSLRGRLVVLPATAATSFARYAQEGVLRRGARNLGLLTRYLLGADPVDLANRYRRR